MIIMIQLKMKFVEIVKIRLIFSVILVFGLFESCVSHKVSQSNVCKIQIDVASIPRHHTLGIRECNFFCDNPRDSYSEIYPIIFHGKDTMKNIINIINQSKLKPLESEWFDKLNKRKKYRNRIERWYGGGGTGRWTDRVYHCFKSDSCILFKGDSTRIFSFPYRIIVQRTTSINDTLIVSSFRQKKNYYTGMFGVVYMNKVIYKLRKDIIEIIARKYKILEYDWENF